MKKWITPLLSAFTATIISIIVFKDLPDQMAMHFSSGGVADNWISKPFGAFLMPLLALLIPWTIFLSIKLEKNDNKRRRAEAINTPIAAMLSIMLFAVHSFIIAFNLGYKIHVGSFVTILVGILFILIGNLAPRIPQGTMQWPKLSDDNHRKASRFQGRAMMVSGFAFLLLAFLPMNWIMPAFFLLITACVAVIIGSFLYYSRSSA